MGHPSPLSDCCYSSSSSSTSIKICIHHIWRRRRRKRHSRHGLLAAYVRKTQSSQFIDKYVSLNFWFGFFSSNNRNSYARLLFCGIKGLSISYYNNNLSQIDPTWKNIFWSREFQKNWSWHLCVCDLGASFFAENVVVGN